MTGLFRELAERFDSGTSLAIRPRLPGRFEEQEATANPEERSLKIGVESSPTRHQPISESTGEVQSLRPVPKTPPPDQATPPDPVKRTGVEDKSIIVRNANVQNDAEVATAPAPVENNEETLTERHVERRIEARTERVMQQLSKPTTTELPAGSGPIRVETHTTNIETQLQTPGPETAENTRIDAESSSEPTPAIIRIGRIEVAAPRATTPVSAPVQRKVSPPARRAQIHSNVPTGSRLTDRLGWKR